MTTFGRLVVLVVSLLSASAHAGSVLVVDDTPGPGVQFADIASAVAVAQNGDLILVRGGTYGSFTISSRSLTVVADVGAAVDIRGRVTVTQLGASQRVQLRGLRIESPPIVFPGPDGSFDYSIGLELANSNGVTWVEDCSVIGFAKAIHVQAATVNLTRVQAVGLEAAEIMPFFFTVGVALSASQSTLAIDRCSFIGGPGTTFLPPGGAAVDITDSTGFLVATTVQGGKGSDAKTTGPFSSFCFPAGVGGNGLVLHGVSTLLRGVTSTLLPGAGGAADPHGSALGGCGAAAAGDALVIDGGAAYVVDPLSTARSLTIHAPKRTGEVVQFTIQGAVGDQVFLFWGPDPIQAFFPAYSHALQAAPVILVPLVTLPSTTFQFNAIMGPIVSGQLSQVIYAQLAIVDTQNEIILSGPSTIIALDASL